MTQPLSPRALERRLKRNLLKAQHDYFAVCTPGFETVLLQEIKQLPDVQNPQLELGGVRFSGALELMYFSNLFVRSAHRVLLRLASFQANRYPILFDRMKRLPWELYLGFLPSYRVRVSAKQSRLRHHKNIAASTASAISETLAPLGLSPVMSDDASLEVHVRFFQDVCTVSINTSGEHLHKRGYRTHVMNAPLRETLAAASLLSAWQNPQVVLDPMCGSGTLLIEAAQIATKQAPGQTRQFAFEQLPFFHESKWQRFKQEATQNEQQTSVQFIGSDVNDSALDAAKHNAQTAQLLTGIHWQTQDARDLKNTFGLPNENILIASNVPYGERISIDPAILTQIATNLKQEFAGAHYAIISKDARWLNTFTTQNTRRFRNGGISVTLSNGII